uniref:Uncharacterized protein n=1 Tax=Heterorhabditis bacteriophora TaxID=37862 RepID=A0A1I7WIN7_HETBA
MQPIPSSFSLQIGGESVRTIKVKLRFATEDDLNKIQLVVKGHMYIGKGELLQSIPKFMTCVYEQNQS